MQSGLNGGDTWIAICTQWLYTTLCCPWPGFTLYSTIIGQALHFTLLSLARLYTLLYYPTTKALQRALQQPHLLTFFSGTNVLLPALLTEVPHCSSSRSRLLHKIQSLSCLVQDLFTALQTLVLARILFNVLLQRLFNYDFSLVKLKS